MNRIQLNNMRQMVVLPYPTLKATLKWIGSEDGNAILRLTSNVGLNCILNINPNLRGSVFEFSHNKQYVHLIIDSVTTTAGKVSEIVVIVD